MTLAGIHPIKIPFSPHMNHENTHRQSDAIPPIPTERLRYALSSIAVHCFPTHRSMAVRLFSGITKKKAAYQA